MCVIKSEKQKKAAVNRTDREDVLPAGLRLQLYEISAEFRRWTAGRHWSKFVQNCTLISEIVLTSRKLCRFCGKRPFFSPFLAGPIPEGVRLMNNKVEQSQQKVLIQMYNMSCVECS